MSSEPQQVTSPASDAGSARLEDVQSQLAQLERATLPMHLASYTRPVFVLIVIPLAFTFASLAIDGFLQSLGLGGGVHPGFGAGWLRAATVVVGLFFAVNCLVWFIWSVATFARFGQTLEPAHEPKVMIVGGPYRLARSPMIFGVYCGLAAETLLLNQCVAPWLVVFIVWMTFSHLRTNEAPTMAKQFGAAWHEYRATTPAFIPRVWRYRRFNLATDLHFPQTAAEQVSAG